MKNQRSSSCMSMLEKTLLQINEDDDRWQEKDKRFHTKITRFEGTRTYANSITTQEQINTLYQDQDTNRHHLRMTTPCGKIVSIIKVMVILPIGNLVSCHRDCNKLILGLRTWTS